VLVFRRLEITAVRFRWLDFHFYSSFGHQASIFVDAMRRLAAVMAMRIMC
jgi:hypothetical protein